MEEIPGHIKAPNCVELKASQVDNARIGAFSLIKIAKDAEFGPYHGKIVYDKHDETVDPKYSWEVFDLETFKFLHIVDATDPINGNWMRYVCCARFFEEQNIVSTQNGEEVFYKALKDIEAGEELLTWFQPKKKKRKRSSIRLSTEALLPDPDFLPESQLSNGISAPPSPEKGKRKRKPKIFPDAYHGPLEPEPKKSKQAYDDLFEPLQPGQKRRRRKKNSTDSRNSSSSGLDLEFAEKSVVIKEESNGVDNVDDDASSVVSASSKSGKDIKREICPAMTISEINNSVDWRFPEKGDEYLFELRGEHVTVRNGKKVYKCDICMGLYKHMFSLKRHYLRNHVNYRYLSKADMTNCLINLAQVIQNMRDRGLKVNTRDSKDNEETGCEISKKNGEMDDIEKSDSNVSDSTREVDSSKDNEKTGCETSEKSDKGDDIEKSDSKAGDSTEEVDSNENKTENLSKEQNENEENCEGDNIMKECDDKTEDSIESVNDSNSTELQINGKDSIDSENVTAIEQASEATIENDKTKESLEKSTADSCDGSESASPTEENSEESVWKIGGPTMTMPGLFRCYTCYDVFDTVDDVREHVQNHPQQEEGTCFSCDQCNMRFNYKQNLVRHKKVHEMEGNADTSSSSNSQHSNGCSNDTPSLSSTTNGPTPSQGTPGSGYGQLPAGVARHPQQPETYQVFKCSKCKTKFESLEEMATHVKAEHISGNKFQCIYCGKDFPSMPNMKKHVRFHLGYRVSCRFCPDVFPNVGALRKHTRLSHPDIYKAKLLDKLDQAAAGKKTDAKVNSVAKISENGNIDKNSAEVKSKSDIENSKSAKQEEFAYDHEISFAADEIDDGGSRFKFSCTVCKKRFSNYINMCRHRRKSHSNDSKPRHEELSLSFCHKRKNNISPVLEDPEEVAQFFANVSHNIAINLNCFIDGQSQALEKFVDHIKIDDYSGNFGYNPVESGPLDFTWSRYNFPPNYRPAVTVGFEADKDSVDKSDESDPEDKAEENKLPVIDKLSDTVSEVTENSEAVANTEEGSVEMGRKASGFKVLSGMAISQKHPSTMDNKGDNKYYKLKIEGGSIEFASPAAKNFSHVQKGEYANFQDDLVPSDINRVELPRSRKNSKSDHLEHAKDGRAGRSSSSVNGVEKPSQEKEASTPDKLLKAAQAELEELYDSIENPDCDNSDLKTTSTKESPECLSLLCEKILGIKKTVKGERRNNHIKADDTEESNSENMLLNELSLASHRAATIKLTNGAKSVVPDYSDVPDGSPFFNYESIAFGTNGQVVSVCAICRRHFKDIEGVLRHHWKKHPGSVFQIMEIEQGNGIDSLHFMEPSYVGALAVTDPGLDDLNSMETFSCTKCGYVFRSVSKLHVHIVNCSPIDPMYGSSKIEKSPSKTSWSKKIQRKFNSLLGKDNGTKPDAIGLKNGVKALESKSQKRVFTGCRKRKSMILPDSPEKGLLPKDLSDLRAGYNPNRHIRRRELTELVDTLTCEACGLKFKTIILLERHVKNCTNKEKFKNVHPLACPIMDESLARLKNICFYCEKNFTYSKSLINHFQDFCPVKKARLDKGQLTDEDKVREEEIIERVKRLEEEKLVKDPDHVKKKITWQVGRKPKRKGHAWTYIKKKKMSDSIENGIDNENELSDKDEADADKVDSDTEKDNAAVSEGNVSTEKDDTGVTEKDGTHKENQNLAETTISISVPDGITNAAKVEKSVESDQKSVESEQTCNSFDEVDSASEVSEQQTTNDSSSNKTAEEIEESDKASYEPEMEGSPGPVKETHINDTSLNCTSRYQVNKIIHPDQKSKNTHEPSSKSSFIFKCISKTVDESDTSPIGYKRSNPVPDKKLENTNTLIMRSKRKRERVGKVEEFLRNAFRRKRSSKNQKPEETLAPKTEDVTSDRRSDANKESGVRNELEKMNVEYEADVQQDSESNSLQEITSFSSTPVDTSQAFGEQTDDTDLPAVPLTECQPRKRGRPRKESSDNENRVGSTASYGDQPRKRGRPKTRKDGPVGPPKSSTYVPGKPGRPPKLKGRRVSAAENIVADHQSSTENEENTDTSKTEPGFDQVNSAIVDYNDEIENKNEDVDKNVFEENDRVEQNITESSNSLSEEKAEVDTHRTVNYNDETDQNSQTDTSVDDNIEKCLVENYDECKNQNDEQFSEMPKTNDIFEGKAEVKDIDIKTEPTSSENKQHEMSEPALDVPNVHNSETDIVTVEKDKVDEPSHVFIRTKLDNPISVICTDKASHDQSIGVDVIPVEREDIKHGNILESAEGINSSKEDNISTESELNDLVNFSSKQKTEQDPTVEETSVAEAEETSVAEAEETSVAEAEETSVAEAEETSVAETEETSVAEAEETSVAEAEETSVAEAEETSVAEAEETSVAEAEATSVAEAEETSVAEAEETSVAEAERETLPHESLAVCNNTISEPETCQIENDKDGKVSKGFVNNECDSDIVSKLTDAEDRNQTETANAADKSESSDKPDSAILSSPEPPVHETQQMVLSPSERVKMNKRSCTRDPFTPVWVRKPHKPKLKSPERKTVSEASTSDDNKNVSNTSKQSVAVETKVVEKIDTPITQNPVHVDKKPVFKNRQEAINENLKLLHKQVTLKFAESLKARNSVIVSAGALVNRMSPEKVSSNLGTKNVHSRGIKRKPGERGMKDDIGKNPVKRRAVSGKSDKSEQTLGSPKPVKVAPNEERPERDTAKDKKISKAKGVKR